MLWWLVGLWLASPVLLAIFWLLGSVRREASIPEKPETATAWRIALSAISASPSPALTATPARATTRTGPEHPLPNTSATVAATTATAGPVGHSESTRGRVI